MPLATIPRDERFQKTLAERFSQYGDGYWYPGNPTRALVRVQLHDGLYTVYRRRRPWTRWDVMVEGLASDFDADSFAYWADNFELVAA